MTLSPPPPVSKSKEVDAYYIASLGRDGDIMIPPHWRSVSLRHCAFLATRDCSIKFIDLSRDASCQAYGGQDGTQRLLSRGNQEADISLGLCNFKIKLDDSTTAKFRVHWNHQPGNLRPVLEAWENAKLLMHPMTAETQVLPNGGQQLERRLPPADVTNTHTGSLNDVEQFEATSTELGSGAFGTVFTAVNRKTGCVAAVKKQQLLGGLQRTYLKREINTMRQLKHYRGKQTTAADMWSLFMTIAWTMNLGNFRSQEWRNYAHLLRWIADVATFEWSRLIPLQDLIVFRHKDRATAAQMLVKMFNGVGLTTPLENIPALQAVEPPKKSDIPDRAGALEELRAGRHEISQKDLSMPDASALPASNPDQPIHGERALVLHNAAQPAREEKPLPANHAVQLARKGLPSKFLNPLGKWNINQAGWNPRGPLGRQARDPFVWNEGNVKKLVIGPARKSLGLRFRRAGGGNAVQAADEFVEKPTMQQATPSLQTDEDEEGKAVERSAGDRGSTRTAARHTRVTRRTTAAKNRPVIDYEALTLEDKNQKKRSLIADAWFDRLKNMPGAFPVSLT
ncbi:Protein kinase-like domain protein [Cordyceps fumosorosea ARSEF 2679]|uniref:Protein kinase-like domain protein n=1 Tax=Cordyceps fumosorosea (strain ARSEF 2679) TaxID=1081104 RepID=A0A168BM27_CORFA|nr:Protein kinase-like domain protein [Cordyceps fumosorosea ARSEF 2679]OAA70297.1 Protein kinase-like domain protein [Cordyceps fumosorosea ARSEF 2679]